ncbi:MAG: HEAT repeat domain-containing protein [Candidatus Hermodarchaeota archaeon]
MSKDLKDLIDSIEKEAKSQAELEQIINSLKEELNRLEFTVNEQKIIIENLKSQMKDDELEQANLPSEIDVLKDIIMIQRKDLEEKDNLIDKLNEKILQFDMKVENKGDLDSKEILNEEFFNAQKLIVQLTDENEQYKNQIEQLQHELEDIKPNEEDSEEFLDEETKIKENEELINFKRLNFQLMQENGLLRVEIESLKAKLQERIDETSSEELYNAYERIDDLSLEIEDYKTQLDDLNVKLQKNRDEVGSEELSNAHEKIYALNLELENYKTQLEAVQEQLEASRKPITVTTEEALEFATLRESFDDLKSKLNGVQQENQILKEKLIELEKINKDLESVKVYSTAIPKGMPKKIKHTLFHRMYRLLDEENRNKVIDFLILDLKSKNSETKSNAIKILSQIKNDKIFDAFLEIIDDQDWIVRYNLIKALNQFENKSDELKDLLKKLTRDVDVDVRELAGKILNDFSK